MCASAEQHSATITVPERGLPPPDEVQIARRFPGYIHLASKVIRRRKIFHVDLAMPRHPRDISDVQFKWRMYLRRVHALCEPAFWQFFLPLHSLSAVAIDTALHAARKTFQSHRFTSFPTSSRTLLQKVMCPHACLHVSLCFTTYVLILLPTRVLMLHYVCPQAVSNISSWFTCVALDKTCRTVLAARQRLGGYRFMPIWFARWQTVYSFRVY